MKKENVKKATKKAIEEILKSDTSKSARIKALFDAGLETKEIAELLGIRYNFAYNVISNYANMNDIKVSTKKDTVSKKDLIINLYKQGKSNKEISIELKTNYNYVFNTLKAYKQDAK
jgi:DNA-binding CsgD family transcriptional regulator